MPHDADIEFGKRAVAEGLIAQPKFDEALMLLHSFEMAGSEKRLWDLLQDKGWLKPADVVRLRGAAAAEHKRAAPMPTTGHPEGTFVIVYLPPKLEAQFHRLLHRPLNIGSDKKSDIVIEEPGVGQKHARIAYTDNGPVIWDVGTETGVLMNGVRRTTTALRDGDLIKIGEALLVVLFEPHGKGETLEPFNPNAVEGELIAKLHVEAGARKGQTIHMDNRPLIIGRHRLATARLEDRHVTPLHTHLVATSLGMQITDLRSAIGTRLNDMLVNQAVLNNGDLVGVGDARFRFESAGKLLQQSREAEPAEEMAPVEMPDIPADVELDMDEAEETSIGMAAEPLAGAKAERYKLGELVLTAIEGPIEGKFVVINKPKLIIGRAGTSDVFIPDLSVSRKHAAVTLSSQGALEIEDLNSRNGVYINNRQVRKAALRTGDAIRIGSSALIVDRRVT